MLVNFHIKPIAFNIISNIINALTWTKKNKVYIKIKKKFVKTLLNVNKWDLIIKC